MNETRRESSASVVAKKSIDSHESGTREISLSSGLKSTLHESKEIQLLDSNTQSESLSAGIDRSLNLLDSTMTDLHGYMKGMFANKPPVEIVSADPDRVAQACLTARQINELMRTKLDILKFKRKAIPKDVNSDPF